jgi:hypothetical protein
MSSIIENSSLSSPLGAASALDPKSGRGKKSLAQTLMLTSLVDAFSILVVYLLMSYSSTGEILYISKDIVLPVSEQADVLDRQIIVKYEQGKYFIENEMVTKDQLFPTLLKMKVDFKQKYPELDSENKVIIQADKDDKFIELDYSRKCTSWI